MPHYQRQYRCNDEFFTDVQTQEQAYWLGFLMADACISPRTAIRLQLTVRDREHLTKFLAAVEANHPIHVYPKQPNDIAVVIIHSPKMTIDLASYGVTPRKTGKEIIPDIPKRLIRHFMRGYFDGDGWFLPTPPNDYRFRLAGSRPFLEQVQRHLIAHCQVSSTRIADYPGVCRLSYSGRRQVFRIARYFYRGARVYLERKRVMLPATIR